MSNLPKGWEEVSFDNFFKTIPAKKYQIQKKDYLQKSIYPIIDQGQKFIIAYSNQSEKVLKNSNGLIIFGDHTRIIKFIDFDFIVGADGTQILDTKNNVDIKFAYYTLLFKEIVSLGYSRHFKIIKEFNYLVPPLEEQKKIADILSTVDKKIAFVEENINATEELKKGLMQKLLTEGIGHTEFKDSELGRIPESWEVAKIEDITEVVTKGTTPTTLGYQYENSGINFIKIESIDKNGNFDKSLFAYISEEANIALKRSIILENDLLYSIAGALGRVAIVNKSILPANTNQALSIIRLKDKSKVKYIYYYLNSPYIKNHIDKVNVQNAQANLSLQNIKNFKIGMPPLEEQKQIAEILSTVDNKLENLKEKKQSFEELKKGLMQKLLTGEVRV
ncbi:restriction endonuclease subunit S [Aliarcobacter cryaerophilus]|uniref:restriction endonuclease subunit S n=1 Tax=Aliarcobacter cryaerophilus TaxID=28198 RepID=UPI00112F464B|nr:restriction endonuclease subunit S [Aliarcobacter cryaerophilus]